MGLMFRYLTLSSDINNRVLAPSFIFEALAAVMVPVLLNAGLSSGIFSFLNLLGSSSSVIYVLSLPTMGVILFLRWPAFMA